MIVQKSTLTILMVLVFSLSNAQDIIIFRNGNDDVFSKIMEVGEDEIKYKKYSNLDGPIYTLSISKISLIKYENGSIDEFDNSSTTSPNYVRDTEFETNDEFTKFLIPNKSKLVIFDYQFNIDKVFEATEVYYYGADFSNFVLINPEKLHQEAFLAKYIPAWNGKFEKELTPNKYINRWLKKEELIPSQHELFDHNFTVDREWITNYSNELKIEHVSQIIEDQLSIIEHNSGIGFVIIVDSFNKPDRTSSCIFTFFDLETKELLWSSKVTGFPGGKGMSQYWGFSIVSSIKGYIDNLYLKTYRSSKNAKPSNPDEQKLDN